MTNRRPSPCGAQKAARYLHDQFPALRLLVSCDTVEEASVIPWPGMERCVLRLRERCGYVDPAVGLRLADALGQGGIEAPLGSDCRSSKADLFSWVAPTVSLGLPVRGSHTASGRVSLRALEHAVAILSATPELI